MAEYTDIFMAYAAGELESCISIYIMVKAG